ncbi:SrfA family protein [Citrobacter amalonaticus]|uniref:SrfA family protein n=1 Tax=Citrobacter amalonaticus TaxID=35703 RepID=UPI0031F31ECD
MRNSIQGPLLRTGHNSSFKALGETGYPVFKMAFQLREAIYRLDAGRDLARHLAIPQNDQGGDRTDWYSSFPGDVIPWSGASEAERESARQQFNAFQMSVQALSEQLLNAEQNGTGGDRRVFAQLLKSVTHFPDYEFVYLVNGILVITFWGFVHPEGEQRNPMHWLSPASLPATPLAASTPLSPVDAAVTPAVTPVVDTVVRRRWSWRWLLWLLLALLLLALLLGLLRGCVPSLSIPGLPAITTDKTAIDTAPAIERPAVGVSDVTTQVSRTGSETVVGSAVVPGISEGTPVDAQQALEPTSPAVPAETTTAQVGDDAIPPAVPVSDANADASTTPAPPAVPGTADAQMPPAVQPATTPPVIPAQGTPLTLPPALPDGPAQFLNGEWRVNGGIQDKLTGRPLQLQYNFAQGNGTVSIRQSSGVTCRGPASGNVQQGALSITNPEQMKCSDGSNFIVPTIECKSPAAGHADCIGSNDGEKTFPIRMLQPNS